MQCKFCKAEMEADRKYCPVCGKRQDSSTKSGKSSPKKKTQQVPTWQIVLAIVLSVLIVGLLVYLFVSGDNGFGSNKPGTNATEPLERENTKIDYAAYANDVVATMFDRKLTNGMLQVFYSSILTEFYSDYSSSLSYIGLNISEPLDEQVYPYEGAETWHDFFLDLALERWKNCVLMCKMAEEDGYVLEKEWTDLIEEQMGSLEEIAKQANYANAAVMLQTYYGEACTVELYNEYLVLDATANAYYYYMLEVDDEQIDAAYEKYKDEFAKKGITLDSALASSVRHILIAPEGGSLGEDGKTTVYTDAEWAACLAEAESVYNEWKNGDATEESFIALVSKYTDDTASKSIGGLYEGVARDGYYVAEFEAWATNIARKAGDAELVRTQFGYHFMYYVSGEPEWKHYSRLKAQEDILAEQDARMVTLEEENPATVSRDKAVMQNVYQMYY